MGVIVFVLVKCKGFCGSTTEQTFVFWIIHDRLRRASAADMTIKANDCVRLSHHNMEIVGN